MISSCYYENEEDLYGKLEEKVWTSDIITFTKTDNSDESLAENQDRITDNVWITRKLSGGQIYNAVVRVLQIKTLAHSVLNGQKAL